MVECGSTGPTETGLVTSYPEATAVGTVSPTVVDGSKRKVSRRTCRNRSRPVVTGPPAGDGGHRFGIDDEVVSLVDSPLD
jgi:hypothetical protein